MHSVAQNFFAELADNWIPLLYILMTGVFSVYFLRERRLEAKIVKEVGTALQKQINTRFDRLEQMVGGEIEAGPGERAGSHPPASVSRSLSRRQTIVADGD